MDVSFRLPPELSSLIDAGIWPNAGKELEQNLSPIVPVDVVQRFAPDEDGIFFHPPPFYTIATCALRSEFWAKHAAPDQIDFANALVIGDFGLGSDAPIILDYSSDRNIPSVKRLQWDADGNNWVHVCDTFLEFADLLGLTPS